MSEVRRLRLAPSAILKEKRALLDQLSALLIAVETIEGDDLSQ